MTINKGRKFLSDLKLYSDFLGWKDDKDRYETWEEAVEEVFDTHRVKYADKLEAITPYLSYAEQMYKEKRFLASQRNLQFRGEDIFKHEFRLFNCLVTYADKISFFGNAFYLLLCGCGVGVNMMTPFVKRLPNISRRSLGTKTFIVQDSIEGWSQAAHVLMNSYSSYPLYGKYEEYRGYEIKFDYSQIRPKGSRVGKKFKAPGPDGLKKAFEEIENLLNSYVEEYPKPFKSILAYDAFMHLSDAVLSGGVRRSACSIIVSPDDTDMIYAKVGNWRETNKQRERSNNSVGLVRGTFTKREFYDLLSLNEGTSDIGFVFMNHIYENMNPCFEIGFTALVFDYNNQSIIDRIMQSDESLMDEGLVRTAIQCCNLNEINGALVKTPEELYAVARAASITGTLQAGYTNFKNLEDVLEDTIMVSQREALLGVSIAGWTSSPWLFDADVLQKAARIVVDTNTEVAGILGINPSARTTTVKPGGNGPIVLMCPSGVTPEHSEQYFRVMQLNKQTETAKYIEEHMPFLLEESEASKNGTDYVVFVPIENPEGTLVKDELQGVEHLEKIKLIMDNWVSYGKVESRCIIPTTSHNVSNTVIIKDIEAMRDYIFKHQDSFTAVSFMSNFGDKDWNQAPNTSILNFSQIQARYGDGALMASGLIVDGLHAFENNLWVACDAVMKPELKLSGDRYQVFLKKDWIGRAKRFADNYFSGNVQLMLYCLKDVHLFHKWHTINRQFKEVNFAQILSKPSYKDVSDYAAIACSNGACELPN